MKPQSQKSKDEYDAVYFVATAIIRNQDNKLLLIKRSSNGSFVNHWQIPEGKVEMKEKPRSALVREIKEETSLKVTKLQPTYQQSVIFKHPNVGKIYFQRFIFETDVDEDEIKLSHEHSDYAWMSPKEALKEEKLVPGLREILENLLS